LAQDIFAKSFATLISERFTEFACRFESFGYSKAICAMVVRRGVRVAGGVVTDLKRI